MSSKQPHKHKMCCFHTALVYTLHLTTAHVIDTRHSTATVTSVCRWGLDGGLTLIWTICHLMSVQQRNI